MSKQVIHGDVIYETMSQAADLIGVKLSDLRSALKIGYLKGKRIAIYTGPEPNPEPAKAAPRSPALYCPAW